MEDEVQKEARRIFKETVERELDRGATDNQAYDRAQKAADDYVDRVEQDSRPH